MRKASRLTRTFFDRSVHDVAPDLVGATLLLDGICGVRIDRRSGVAWLVDPELAVAVRDAFSGEPGELRRLRRMGAMPVVRRAS